MTSRFVAGLALAGAVTLSACAGTVSGHGALGRIVPTTGGSSGAAPTGPSNPTGRSAPTGSSVARGANARLTGSQLEQAAKRAFSTATSFHMKGAGTDSGSAVGFDIHYGKSSSRGWIEFDGLRVNLLYADRKIYMKAGRDFWSEIVHESGISAGPNDKAAIALLQGKWVHIPPQAAGISEIAQFAVREKFLAEAVATPDTDTYAKGPSKSIRGIATVSFVDNEDGSTVYVPATGKPYPIRIEGHGSDSGSFDLTQWDVAFSAAPPPAGEVVELPH